MKHGFINWLNKSKEQRLIAKNNNNPYMTVVPAQKSMENLPVKKGIKTINNLQVKLSFTCNVPAV